MKNHLTRVKAEMEATKVEVADVTGYSVDDINAMIFERGEEWLLHIGCDSQVANYFMQTPEFWGFWRKTWYDADRMFLRHYYAWLYDAAYVKEWYNQFHNVTGEHMNSREAQLGYHMLIKQLAVKR